MFQKDGIIEQGFVSKLSELIKSELL